MKNLLLIAAFFLAGAGTCLAQPMTLQQCIDTALARNLELRRSGLAAEAAGIQLANARAARLPDLNANLYHGFNQGRGIDPTSNSYVNQSLNFANYQLASGVMLYNGGVLRNTQLQAATASEAARLEAAAARDLLVLNVIRAYLQLLVNEDLVATLTQSSELSRQQYERLRILDERGAIRPSDLSDMKGQWVNDRLALVNAQNAQETARLALAQWLNKPYDPSLRVARLDTAAFRRAQDPALGEVLSQAQSFFPTIKAAGLRVQSARYGLQAARGTRLPSLSLGAGIATAYSSTARDANGKTSYNSQLRNNLSTTVGLGLAIPIFNRLQTRGRIRLADVEWRRSELQGAIAAQQLEQQVEAAWLALQQARERLSLAQEAVDAYAQSFGAAEARYTAGVGNSVDYLIAKDRLDRARLALVTARYDLELRRQVLDYFRGKP